MQNKNEYLTEIEVAQMTRIAVQTLRNCRSKRTGFPYIRIGRKILYSLNDVISYIESRKIKPTN